jgi:hypothetical protein
MFMTSVLFRNDDEYEEEEEQKVYEGQMQSTLRKSGYVKQIGKFLQ